MCASSPYVALSPGAPSSRLLSGQTLRTEVWAPPSTSHVTRATEHVWAGCGLHEAPGREGKWGLKSSPAPGSVLLEGGFLEGHLLGQECPSGDLGR